MFADVPLMAFAVAFPDKESSKRFTYRANLQKLKELTDALEITDEEADLQFEAKAEQMKEIFDAVHEVFTLTEDAEITIEMNPGTVTEEKLKVYKEIGVNRLSIGVQSFNENNLMYLVNNYKWSFNKIKLVYQCLFIVGITVGIFGTFGNIFKLVDLGIIILGSINLYVLIKVENCKKMVKNNHKIFSFLCYNFILIEPFGVLMRLYK